MKELLDKIELKAEKLRELISKMRIVDREDQAAAEAMTLDILQDIGEFRKEQCEMEKALIFVEHIEEHLKEMGLAKVVCKICHKTIDTIYQNKRTKEACVNSLR